MNASGMQENSYGYQKQKGEKYHEKFECGSEKGSGQAG